MIIVSPEYNQLYFNFSYWGFCVDIQKIKNKLSTVDYENIKFNCLWINKGEQIIYPRVFNRR